MLSFIKLRHTYQLTKKKGGYPEYSNSHIAKAGRIDAHPAAGSTDLNAFDNRTKEKSTAKTRLPRSIYAKLMPIGEKILEEMPY
jgi:hypothetical protein